MHFTEYTRAVDLGLFISGSFGASQLQAILNEYGIGHVYDGIVNPAIIPEIINASCSDTLLFESIVPPTGEIDLRIGKGIAR